VSFYVFYLTYAIQEFNRLPQNPDPNLGEKLSLTFCLVNFLMTMVVCSIYSKINLKTSKKHASLYGFILLTLGNLSTDYLIRADRIDFLSLAIPTTIISIGFSMGIGSTTTSYCSLICTIQGLSAIQTLHWLLY
jgi:hypothetical protein